MVKGDVVRVSQMREDDCGTLAGRKFIVRTVAHQAKSVSLRFEDGSSAWVDISREDPEVQYIGKGQLDIKVTILWPK